MKSEKYVIPAEAGIQVTNTLKVRLKGWIPAFAGMTIGVLISSGYVFAETNPALINEGKVAFGMHCARCHGPQGKGDGMDAKRVPVPPRDLTEGIFKFQSTESGTPPSDADLLWTLNHGLSGSGMPSFGNLSDDVKSSLVAYVKTLSPIFADQEPKAIAAPNERARVDAKKGREIYDKLQCGLCHGAEGRANGTSAAALKDGWGRPIKPANLMQGWTYRAGDSATQIYYRLMAGINGAPMPSYAEAVSSPDEAWQLAKYVESLQLKTSWVPNIYAAELAELPSTFDDKKWNGVRRTDVNLAGSSYSSTSRENTSINAVSVQAAFNDESVVYRLFWSDPVKSEGAPSDALLIAWVPENFTGKGVDNLHNLYSGDDRPLSLGYWTAAHPTKLGHSVSTVRAATQPGYRFDKEHKAVAEFRDGMWTLVVTVPKSVGAASRLGFAAWDGDSKEAGLKRAASQWIHLSMGVSADHH